MRAAESLIDCYARKREGFRSNEIAELASFTQPDKKGAQRFSFPL
jgi:hypothetical protein